MSKNVLITEVEKALINIRPYLEADGGDVRVVDIDDDGKVTLELLGNCSLCPMSEMTFAVGVEEAIKRAVPQITEVEAVNLTSPDDPKAKLPSQLP
ncbi:MAG: NifU family protein [Cytophagales bacterium]|nr:NifU family protein [Cytophagales bacterium]